MCCSYTQSGDCPYGTRCRFIHPEDLPPCNTIVQASHSPVQAVPPSQITSYAAQMPAAVTGCNSLPPTLPCNGSGLAFKTPSQASLAHPLPYTTQKLASPNLSMLPHYAASHIPVPWHDMISHLWSTDCKEDLVSPAYLSRAEPQTATAQHAHHMRVDQPPYMYRKFNIWAATDPLADIRMSPQQYVNAALPLPKLRELFSSYHQVRFQLP